MSARRPPADERVVGRLLLKKGLTLAVAESCTGGLIGDRFTDVPGSSRYFAGGVIAYSNSAKVATLDVRKQTLAKWGAVSEQTVREMAAGVCRRLGAEAGVAVSGIAGPGGGSRRDKVQPPFSSAESGGSPAKPVGLVYICVKVGRRIEVERHRFRGGRRSVKEQAATAALGLCRRILEDWVEARFSSETRYSHRFPRKTGTDTVFVGRKPCQSPRKAVAVPSEGRASPLEET